MRNWFRRHRCPPGIILTVKINGETVIGPVDSEQLALIAKYGSFSDDGMDMLGYSEGWSCQRKDGGIKTLDVKIKYKEMSE